MISPCKQILPILFIAFLSFVTIPGAERAAAQRPIVITADQPNIWTLEQAHYLLAQMHRRNLDLKAKNVGELDANAINGVTIDVLKTLLEASVEFDEAKGFTNKQLKNEKEFEFSRRQELLARRANLQDQSLSLTQQIAALQIKKLQTKDEAEQQNIAAQIAQLEIVQAAVKTQLDDTKAELDTLPAPSGSFQSVKPDMSFDRSKLAGSLDSVFSTTAKTVADSFASSPQLNASLRLENYLQMQYEILSKQLTLLRDEVGPGERLIFMEMPQSINVSHDEASKRWAQSWWKIRGYTTCKGKGAPASSENKPASQAEDMADKLHHAAVAAVEVAKYNLEVIIESRKGKGDKDTPAASGEDLNEAQVLLETVLKIPAETEAGWKKGKEAAKLASLIETAVYNEVDADVMADLRSKRDAAVKEAINLNLKTLMLLGDVLAGNAWRVAVPESQDKKEDVADDVEGAEAIGKKFFQNEAKKLAVGGVSVASITSKGYTSSSLLKKWDLTEGFDDEDDQDVPCDSGVLSSEQATELAEDNSEKMNTLLATDKANPHADDNLEVVDLNDVRISEKLKSLNLKWENRKVRVIEVLPRQSSLNVNSLKLKNNQYSLKGLFSFLSGVGIGASFQSQRERYSQFVQQELYSSGFGKGSREFGWTFNPMPGMQRLMSGVRTTYAIAVIPREAQSIIMESTGCYFQRANEQPVNFAGATTAGKRECGDKRAFIIPIPGGNGDQNFFVKALYYTPVGKGKKIVVSIKGTNFSTQIGILVNGVPLKQSLGLGQIFIRDDSTTGAAVKDDLKDEKLPGNFERIDSGQVLASFQMPDDYEGTPTITLVAPGKAVNINPLKLCINKTCRTKGDLRVLDKLDYMFGRKYDSSGAEQVKLGKLTVFKTVDFEISKKLSATIAGKNLNVVTRIIINGRDFAATDASVTVRPSFIKIDFDRPVDKSLQIVLITAGGDALNAGTVENPAVPTPPAVKFKVEKDVKFIDYQKDAGGKEFAVVLLTGVGLDKATTNKGTLSAISPTEAILKIDKTLLPEVVEITSEDKKEKERIVVTNKPPEEEKPKPGDNRLPYGSRARRIQ